MRRATGAVRANIGAGCRTNGGASTGDHRTRRWREAHTRARGATYLGSETCRH
jgi:hypothetical protein